MSANRTSASDGIADASTTTFTIDAGGVDKTVSVYALGFEMPGQAGPDGADRQGFAQLAELLTDFEKEARAGQVDELMVYEPETYRVMLIDGGGQGGVEWPWDGVALDDFEKTGEYGPLVAGMTPDQVAGIVDVPNGGAMGRTVVAPDGGSVYGLAIRPLLPGETAEIDSDPLA